jgi:hypothetical protein
MLDVKGIARCNKFLALQNLLAREAATTVLAISPEIKGHGLRIGATLVV